MDRSSPLQWKNVVLAGVVALLSACAQTETRYSDLNSGTTAETISNRYPEGSITSVAIADQALADVRTERPTIRRQLAVDERACYERFFTNLCLRHVEERERSALEQLRRVEVEANAFKRRDKVKRRDERQSHKESRRQPIPVDMNAMPVKPDQ